jgi:hypothetical protein
VRTEDKEGEERRRGRRGGNTRKEDEAGGQVLGGSVTMGRQKFNKRQSGSLHIFGEGLSVLLIRADDTV